MKNVAIIRTVLTYCAGKEYKPIYPTTTGTDNKDLQLK